MESCSDVGIFLKELTTLLGNAKDPNEPLNKASFYDTILNELEVNLFVFEISDYCLYYKCFLSMYFDVNIK